MHVFIYVFMYVCMHVYIYACMYVGQLELDYYIIYIAQVERIGAKTDGPVDTKNGPRFLTF